MIERDMEASGETVVKPVVLTYKKFRREYWPHFQHSLRKGLGMFCFIWSFQNFTIRAEPSMVFSEFLGTEHH